MALVAQIIYNECIIIIMNMNEVTAMSYKNKSDFSFSLDQSMEL